MARHIVSRTQRSRRLAISEVPAHARVPMRIVSWDLRHLVRPCRRTYQLRLCAGQTNGAPRLRIWHALPKPTVKPRPRWSSFASLCGAHCKVMTSKSVMRVSVWEREGLQPSQHLHILRSALAGCQDGRLRERTCCNRNQFTCAGYRCRSCTGNASRARTPAAKGPSRCTMLFA